MSRKVVTTFGCIFDIFVFVLIKEAPYHEFSNISIVVEARKWVLLFTILTTLSSVTLTLLLTTCYLR